MASLQRYQFLFIFCLLPFSKAIPSLPSLLSLNCSPPSQQSLTNAKPIQAFLDNLTFELTKTHFITSTINHGRGQINGLMQCRLDLDPTTCTLYVQNAVHTISNMCPNSDAATAWFEGCYLQYSYHNDTSSHAYLQTTKLSCSNQTNVMDRAQFEPTLETLLLQLRAEINVATHQRFSTGEIQYGNGSKIFALAECVHSVPLKECEFCVEKGTDKLHEHCGGKEGGIVIAGSCIVRYEHHQFFSHLDTGELDSGGELWTTRNLESGNGDHMSFKVKVALAWGVGLACLIGVMLCAWQLRRSIINSAKVVTFGGADDNEMGSKGVA